MKVFTGFTLLQGLVLVLAGAEAVVEAAAEVWVEVEVEVDFQME